MTRLFKTPLILEPQKEGGWTITSPLLPELITEVDDLKDLQVVVSDAISAVIELYEDMGKQIPSGLMEEIDSTVWFETLVPAET